MAEVFGAKHKKVEQTLGVLMAETLRFAFAAEWK